MENNRKEKYFRLFETYKEKITELNKNPNLNKTKMQKGDFYLIEKTPQIGISGTDPEERGAFTLGVANIDSNSNEPRIFPISASELDHILNIPEGGTGIQESDLLKNGFLYKQNERNMTVLNEDEVINKLGNNLITSVFLSEIQPSDWSYDSNLGWNIKLKLTPLTSVNEVFCGVTGKVPPIVTLEEGNSEDYDIISSAVAIKRDEKKPEFDIFCYSSKKINSTLTLKIIDLK